MDSMNDQPDHIKREYDQYSLERDRAELERLLIRHEQAEEMREEMELAYRDAERMDHAEEDLIMSDIEQQERDEDDQKWDQEWDDFLTEMYDAERIERDHDEDDQRRNDL